METTIPFSAADSIDPQGNNAEFRDDSTFFSVLSFFSEVLPNFMITEAETRISKNFSPDFFLPQQNNYNCDREKNPYLNMEGVRVQGEKILDEVLYFTVKGIHSSGEQPGESVLTSDWSTTRTYKSWVTRDEACWVNYYRNYANLRATCKHLHTKLNSNKMAEFQEGINFSDANRGIVRANSYALVAHLYCHLVARSPLYDGDHNPVYQDPHTDSSFRQHSSETALINSETDRINFIISLGRMLRCPFDLITANYQAVRYMSPLVFNLYLDWVLDVYAQYPVESFIRRKALLYWMCPPTISPKSLIFFLQKNITDLKPNVIEKAIALGLFADRGNGLIEVLNHIDCWSRR
jgi:hypothetical protein